VIDDIALFHFIIKFTPQFLFFLDCQGPISEATEKDNETNINKQKTFGSPHILIQTDASTGKICHTSSLSIILPISRWLSKMSFSRDKIVDFNKIFG
jgi:hypothetical protein